MLKILHVLSQNMSAVMMLGGALDGIQPRGKERPKPASMNRMQASTETCRMGCS